MGTEVAVRRPRDIAAAVPAKLEYARALADSGLLPAQYRRNPANVLYALEYGEMLGLSAMAAITGVHVIEGKPTASAGLISALVRRAGHKLRVRGDANSATCEIVRSDDPDYTFKVTWTLRRNPDGHPNAEDAGLLGKDVWKKYGASMLKSRAITQCARDACEEALFGLHYTPEELGAEVDEEGQIVAGEVITDAPVADAVVIATDEEWLAQALGKVPQLGTLGECRGLWAESTSMVTAGQCTREDAGRLQDDLRDRMEQLRQAETGQPAREAQEGPGDAEGSTDDSWLVRIRDIATADEAEQVADELFREFGDELAGDGPRLVTLRNALADRTAEVAGVLTGTVAP